MAKDWKPEKDPTDEVTMAQVLDRMAQIMASNQAVQQAQLKQTAPRSNTQPPLISAYNPRGQKDFAMPELKCEIEAAFPMTPTLHALDREEVELFNLLEPGEFVIAMIDDTQQPVNIIGQKNAITGKWEKLALRGLRDPDTGKYVALFTHTNKQTFPPMRVFLRQILGEKANGVLPIKEEIRRTKLPAEDADRLPVSLGA